LIGVKLANNMKISLIIAVYNEEKRIKECLDSLSKQTYKDMEVIVVDDGSTDSTFSLCTMYYALCTVFQQKHQGAGAARNLGATKATGDILVFVDADMVFKEDFVEKLVAPVIVGKSRGVFSKEEYLANKDNVWAVCWNLNRNLPADRMHPKNYPDKQRVFRAILKKEFDRVGGFNVQKGYIDDWSLSEKLGYLADNSPGAIFYHHNPDNLKDVFIQSKWMGKREYKSWVLAILRVSLPVSLIMGLLKSVQYALPAFLIFKIVSDIGIFVGIIEKVLLGRVAK